MAKQLDYLSASHPNENPTSGDGNATDFQIDIKIEEALDFLRYIGSSLSELNPDIIEKLYIYSKEKQAIVVSVDVEGQPFWGSSRGYNPPSSRIYFPDEVKLFQPIVDRIGVIRNEIGGRVFLDSNGAFCLKEGEKIDLVNWQWPKGDFVQEILSIRDACLRTNTGI